MRRYNPEKMREILGNPFLRLSEVQRVAGVSKNCLHKLISGSEPRANTLVGIADALGLDLDLFFDSTVPHREQGIAS